MGTKLFNARNGRVAKCYTGTRNFTADSCDHLGSIKDE